MNGNDNFINILEILDYSVGEISFFTGRMRVLGGERVSRGIWVNWLKAKTAVWNKRAFVDCDSSVGYHRNILRGWWC